MIKQVNQLSKEDKEKLINNIKEYLKNSLSEKRYIHSISTMDKAKEINKNFNLDEQIVMMTALSHDIAKEMTYDEMIKYAEENNIKLTYEDKLVPTVLHSIIGAHIVKVRYGFTKEMQDAIYYHTTARANMTLLDKIVFLADKTENTRQGKDDDELRKMLKEEGLDRAILWDIDYYSIPKTISNQKMIHPNSIYARNDIISKMKKE